MDGGRWQILFYTIWLEPRLRACPKWSFVRLFQNACSHRVLQIQIESKGTSVCFISQMLGKIKFRKIENAIVCEIAAFTLFPNFSFLKIWEMKQRDIPPIHRPSKKEKHIYIFSLLAKWNIFVLLVWDILRKFPVQAKLSFSQHACCVHARGGRESFLFF